MAEGDSALRAQYPAIPWNEPLPVRVGDPARSGGLFYVCRYCVASKGLKGVALLDGSAGYRSRKDAMAHIGTHTDGSPGPAPNPMPTPAPPIVLPTEGRGDHG